MDMILKIVPSAIRKEGYNDSWIPFNTCLGKSTYVHETKVHVLPAQPGLYVVSYDGQIYDVVEFSSLDQFSRLGRVFNYWFSKPLNSHALKRRDYGDEFRPTDPSRPYLCYYHCSYHFVSLDSLINMPPIDKWYDDAGLYPIETTIEGVIKTEG